MWLFRFSLCNDELFIVFNNTVCLFFSKKDLPMVPLKVFLHIIRRKLRATFLSHTSSPKNNIRSIIWKGRLFNCWRPSDLYFDRDSYLVAGGLVALKCWCKGRCKSIHHLWGIPSYYDQRWWLLRLVANRRMKLCISFHDLEILSPVDLRIVI